ncbi:MAG TPA: hypothetical protein VGE14_09720 [Marmoricola sp.]
MTPVARQVVLVAGVVLVALAIATSLALGTIGWAAVGFGVMTDCTNEYSCTSTGCPPCDTASRWITTGGIAQLGLALAGVVVLVRGLRTARTRAALPLMGVLLLASSAGVITVTTSAAQASYCRVDSPGYEQSYCSTDG